MIDVNVKWQWWRRSLEEILHVEPFLHNVHSGRFPLLYGETVKWMLSRTFMSIFTLGPKRVLLPTGGTTFLGGDDRFGSMVTSFFRGILHIKLQKEIESCVHILHRQPKALILWGCWTWRVSFMVKSRALTFGGREDTYRGDIPQSPLKKCKK